jgi:hypothetical protein
MKTQRGYRGIAVLSLTLPLTPHLGLFTLRKEIQCPFYRRLGRIQSRFGRAQNILTPLGFDPRAVQPVASCCAD